MIHGTDLSFGPMTLERVAGRANSIFGPDSIQAAITLSLGVIISAIVLITRLVSKLDTTRRYDDELKVLVIKTRANRIPECILTPRKFF